MRTTWNRAIVAGALAASGLPALIGAPASAQGITGGMAVPPSSSPSYTSPSTNTAASPYGAAMSPYGSSAGGLGSVAGAPGGGSYATGVSAAGGTIGQAAPSNYGARGNAGTVRAGSTSPYGSPEYAPSASRYASATPPSPYLPATPGASAPTSAGTSPYASNAAGLGGRAVAPSYPSNAAGLGGRAVAPSSVMNYSQGIPVIGNSATPGPGGMGLGTTSSNDPSGMRASYANPSAYANPNAAAPGAPSEPVARGSAFASDTMPYGPPPKPSRLRRFYNWLTGDDKSDERPNRTYIDPSTGRTDLPLSKPWLKQVW